MSEASVIFREGPRFMLVNRTHFLSGAAGLTVLLLAGALFEYSPDRQMQKAFIHLIKAAENRNWKAVRGLMADDYRDQWKLDRDQAINMGKDALSQFLALQIVVENLSGSRQDLQGVIQCRLRLSGRGNAVGEMVMQQANALEDDFQFAWKRKSWKPWDWKLVSISQNEIDIDPTQLP